MSAIGDPVEPAVHKHAAAFLRDRGMRVKQIIRVDSESILYLNGAGRAMTAWIVTGIGATWTHTEVGFSAHPPADRPSLISRDETDQA